MRFRCTSNILYVTRACFSETLHYICHKAVALVWCSHLSAGREYSYLPGLLLTTQTENHWFSANRAILENQILDPPFTLNLDCGTKKAGNRSIFRSSELWGSSGSYRPTPSRHPKETGLCPKI